MMTVLPFVISAVIALVSAQALGLFFGLLAIRIYWFGHLSNLLTEVRGSLGCTALCLVALAGQVMSPEVAIGLAAGTSQAIAVARWMTRPGADWAPEELGALAMGQSSAHLALVRGYRRGAVRATASLSILHCLTLWILASEVFPDLGQGPLAAGPWVFSGVLAVLFVGSELLVALVSNRRTRA